MNLYKILDWIVWICEQINLKFKTVIKNHMHILADCYISI